MMKNTGLSEAQAKELLSKHGFNELVEKKQKSNLQKFAEQFQNFIIYVLIAAALVSFFVGEAIDAIAIIFIVILNAILGFVQEYRAEESLKALKRMASPSAKVVRDGEEKIIPAKEIVPGDLIIIEAGDKIPADARIVESVSLQVDESSLTGESVPVAKGTEKKYDETLTPSERKDFVFMGTHVTYGRAKAIVANTGMNTEMGKIAETIQTAEEKKTQLQIRLEEFGKKLSVIILGICGLIFILGVMRGKEVLGMFIAAVSLAVAAIPEGLPAIVTTTLALGVYRMSKQNAIVRKLSSVETLGSTTVICSDKTGTLTENEMTVRKIYVNGRMIDVTGAGYDMEGEFAENKKKISPDADIRTALKAAVLCNNTSLHKKNEKWEVVGDPTEAALLVAGTKAGLERDELERQYPRTFEFFFDSNRKRMSTIHDHGNEKMVFVKGAPDVVLKLCDSYYVNGKEFKLTETQRKSISGKNDEMAQEALRVLAVAYRKLDMKMEKFEQEKTEKNLVFIGLIGMIDPPRKEVRDSIELCRRAGVKAVMITGDHKATAVAVAKELSLLTPGAKVMTGDELSKMSDEAFDAIVEDVVVYARVSPEHKTRIVKALKRKNHIVAMTGDGVNDAPALKNADIGVAMGITGTDVTKESSDMVLADDNFATIVNAVREGRGVYDNIKKFIYYLLSCNISEVVVVFTPILFGLPLPLTAIQILWMNIVTDGFPALALGVQPVEDDVMTRKPRSPKEEILTKDVLKNILFIGTLISIGTLYMFAIELGNVAKAQTMAFMTIVMFQLFHSLNAQSDKSLFGIGLRNKWLIAAFLLSTALQLAVIYIPLLQPVFNTVALEAGDLLKIFAISFLIVVLVELKKRLSQRPVA